MVKQEYLSPLTLPKGLLSVPGLDSSPSRKVHVPQLPQGAWYMTRCGGGAGKRQK